MKQLLKDLYTNWLAWMQLGWNYIDKRNNELEFRWTLFTFLMIIMLILYSIGADTLAILVILFYIAFINTSRS